MQRRPVGDTDDQPQALGWRVLGPQGTKNKHRHGTGARRKRSVSGWASRCRSAFIVASKSGNRPQRKPAKRREVRVCGTSVGRHDRYVRIENHVNRTAEDSGSRKTSQQHEFHVAQSTHRHRLAQRVFPPNAQRWSGGCRRCVGRNVRAKP